MAAATPDRVEGEEGEEGGGRSRAWNLAGLRSNQTQVLVVPKHQPRPQQAVAGPEEAVAAGMPEAVAEPVEAVAAGPREAVAGPPGAVAVDGVEEMEVELGTPVAAAAGAPAPATATVEGEPSCSPVGACPVAPLPPSSGHSVLAGEAPDLDLHGTAGLVGRRRLDAACVSAAAAAPAAAASILGTVLRLTGLCRGWGSDELCWSGANWLIFSAQASSCLPPCPPDPPLRSPHFLTHPACPCPTPLIIPHPAPPLSLSPLDHNSPSLILPPHTHTPGSHLTLPAPAAASPSAPSPGEVLHVDLMDVDRTPSVSVIDMGDTTSGTGASMGGSNTEGEAEEEEEEKEPAPPRPPCCSSVAVVTAVRTAAGVLQVGRRQAGRHVFQGPAPGCQYVSGPRL